jgi:DNA polymerase-3 subunit alpha
VAYKTFNAGTLQSLIKSGAFDLINRNRALLIDNIPDILAISSKDQKSSAVGQRSLFGDLAPIPVAPMRSDVLPFDMMTELEYERELMGIYVSGHPLKALPFNHEFHYSHEAVQIEPIDKGPQVVMCGILRSIKKIVTKSKGQLMAFLQIEDLSGVVSAVLFPGSYIDNELLVNENALVQIFGTMGRDRDGEPQVMINKLKPLQDQRSVLIRIDSLIDSSKLVTLQKVMQQFKGDTPVVFKFSESDDLVVANYSAWINYSSDFVDRIESVLGPDTVDLI